MIVAKRSRGDYGLSCHKYELPGGFKNGDPDQGSNLHSIEFLLNNSSCFSGYSQYQNTVDTGALMHFYKETLINLSTDFSGRSPNFLFDDYQKWLVFLYR